MKDIEIMETCEHCGAHLTLMESLRYPDHTLWLVKRCLKCSSHRTPDGQVEEVAQLVIKK
jgi:hypothetical protein